MHINVHVQDTEALDTWWGTKEAARSEMLTFLYI